MKLICLLILFPIVVHRGHAQSQGCLGNMELWTYGLGDFIIDNAHKIASKNWPFQIKAKMGDVLISEEFPKQLELHNDSLWACLKRNGYKKPRKSYKKDFKNAIVHMEIISEIIGKDPGISHLKSNQLSEFTALEIEKIDRYNYRVEWFSIKDEDSQYPKSVRIVNVKDRTIDSKIKMNIKKIN